MVREYIEIVHVVPEDIRERKGYTEIDNAIADRIIELERTIGVKYFFGDLSSKLPEVPLNTSIRVGGTLWELCVKVRADTLRKSGYTNVMADRDISFALADHRLDCG